MAGTKKAEPPGSQRYFGPAVVDPVRLHVAAKRYLCAVEPDYLAGVVR